ncbi:hypothetical protein U9M48_017464 [Paspalum notatum var. saurae]|uniref:Uncharacterized protein n=1 Tax=Paspalum notatum var. saurae TaxID=547442 RepID=A0AAQ3T7I0_PASNO
MHTESATLERNSILTNDTDLQSPFEVFPFKCQTWPQDDMSTCIQDPSCTAADNTQHSTARQHAIDEHTLRATGAYNYKIMAVAASSEEPTQAVQVPPLTPRVLFALAAARNPLPPARLASVTSTTRLAAQSTETRSTHSHTERLVSVTILVNV